MGRTHESKTGFRRCRGCGDLHPRDYYPNTMLRGSTYCENCSRPPELRKHDPLKQRVGKLKSRYGITPEQYDEMLETQKRRCAICDTGNVELVVDHDHETGSVRALLCRQCNVGIGNLRDDPVILLRGFEYLARYPKAGYIQIDTR